MKKNDTIRCINKADVRQMMSDLSEAGFHAVAGGSNGLTITITAVHETRYIVQAREGAAVQKVYCDTREEADEMYEKFTSGYTFVEMLEGYAGEWKTIKQTW